jgi:hypothetical protein
MHSRLGFLFCDFIGMTETAAGFCIWMTGWHGWFGFADGA